MKSAEGPSDSTLGSPQIFPGTLLEGSEAPVICELTNALV